MTSVCLLQCSPDSEMQAFLRHLLPTPQIAPVLKLDCSNSLLAVITCPPDQSIQPLINVPVNFYS